MMKEIAAIILENNKGEFLLICVITNQEYLSPTTGI
jgi:hypothetical protein